MYAFAWESNKAILFYFTPNSYLQDSIQHWYKEAKFLASAVRPDCVGPYGPLNATGFF